MEFKEDDRPLEENTSFVLERIKDMVDVYTIKQGTSDWHLLRKFSFSSSPSWSSFHTQTNSSERGKGGESQYSETIEECCVKASVLSKIYSIML